MNAMLTVLLLTLLRILLPLLVLMGIGTYIERRQRAGRGAA
jgi:hypothetical protein